MALYSRTDGTTDVVVVGGGIIGLAVARRMRREGLSVALLERGAIGRGASSVAAGMLAPVAEVEMGEHGRAAVELGLRAASMWPAYAAELEELTGQGVGLRPTGILMVARDDDEARELERQAAVRATLGLNAVRLLPSEAREREPALAPSLRAALAVPGDRSVDPRRVLDALCAICEREGVAVTEGAEVAGLILEPAPARTRRVAGVRLRDGAEHRARHVLIAAGAWSGASWGLPGGAGVPVRPVKGQTVRLRDSGGPGLLRGAVRCPGAYLVPRDDGTFVLGASMEERGFDSAPTAGVISDLLQEAGELVPGISELSLEEIAVGLRPGSPDNLPFIGPGAHEGLVWATGHFRNGILLAPLTGELALQALLRSMGTAAGGVKEGDSLLALCDPARQTSERRELVEPSSGAPGRRRAVIA